MHDPYFSASKNMLFWLSAHTRGSRWWWIVFSISIIVILLWLFFAVPIFVPVVLPLPDWIIRYDDWQTRSITLWSVVTIPRKYGGTYFCLIFFVGVPFTMIAWFWAEVSHNLALGRRFICPPPGSILNGDWISD